GQPRLAVDLHRAGAALAGLAVPAAGQVRSLGRLQPVDHVEDDLALVDLNLVVGEFTAVGVASPDPELAHAHRVLSFGVRPESSSSVRYFSSSARSNRLISSGGIGGTGTRSSRISEPSSDSEHARLTLRHCGSMSG